MIRYILRQKLDDGTYKDIGTVPALPSYERASEVAYELKRRKLSKGYTWEIDIFAVSEREAKQHNKKVLEGKRHGYIYY